MDSPGIWIDGALFLIVLCPIIVSDIRYQKIPNIYLLLGAGAVLTRILIFDSQLTPWCLLGAGLGFFFIMIFRVLSKGKIGMGDAKLSGLIGLVLGVPGWILSILTASLAGILYAGVRILLRKMQRTDRIPFAPFLGLGTISGFILALDFGRMLNVHI